MILCLLGKSGSGKSSIVKKMLNYNFKQITMYTTRPIRDNEINGLDYYFIDKYIFLQYIKENKMLAYSEFNGWYYGILNSNIDFINYDYVVALDPIMYRQLKKCINNKYLKSILIYVKDKDRLLRYLNRENKPNCIEMCRRFLADHDMFNDIENIIDFKVCNNYNLETVVHLILKNIICKIGEQNMKIHSLNDYENFKEIIIRKEDELKELKKQFSKSNFFIGSYVGTESIDLSWEKGVLGVNFIKSKKNKNIRFQYYREGRTIICKIINDYGTYIGYAKCHKDDRFDYTTGCTIAEFRARLNMYNDLLIRVTKN